MIPASELLDEAGALFLDFDGPLAFLMPSPVNADAAAEARAALGGERVPAWIADSTDHLAVLRFTLDRYPQRLHDVEAACTRAEVRAAESCEPSPHAQQFFDLAAARALPVAIVSNNSADAVRTFLGRFGWDEQVDAYACRTAADVDELKPSPYLVKKAAFALRINPARAVFVGDSITDVTAGRLADAPVLALVKPGRRVTEFVEAGATAVVQLGDLESIEP